MSTPSHKRFTWHAGGDGGGRNNGGKTSDEVLVAPGAPLGVA